MCWLPHGPFFYRALGYDDLWLTVTPFQWHTGARARAAVQMQVQRVYTIKDSKLEVRGETLVWGQSRSRNDDTRRDCCNLLRCAPCKMSNALCWLHLNNTVTPRHCLQSSLVFLSLLDQAAHPHHSRLCLSRLLSPRVSECNTSRNAMKQKQYDKRAANDVLRVSGVERVRMQRCDM